MSINMILAVGAKNEIGCTSSPDGLPWVKNKEDLSHFQKMTKGNVVVMGGNTFRQLQEIGFENGLPRRDNIVITNGFTKDYRGTRCQVLRLPDIIRIMSYEDKKFFIIGGKSIYEQLHPYCEKIYLTRINQESPDADVVINLDFLEGFDKVENLSLNDYSQVEIYIRK